MKLIGTGASFPMPLYLRWFRDYHLAHPHIRVDYQSIGSAGGVKDLIAGRVDFAGTDLRLTPEEAAEVPGGVRQLPMAAGGIVVIYNLDGVPALKLSRKALVENFSGTIARWNNPAIAATNPNAGLPDKAISVVARPIFRRQSDQNWPAARVVGDFLVSAVFHFVAMHVKYLSLRMRAS